MVKYVIEHFDQKTKRSSSYTFNKHTLHGFNSMLATSSIDVLRGYYAEFKKQIEVLSENKKLKVAAIYSYGANDEDESGMVDENLENTEGLDQSAREFLDTVIDDYNKMFGTSFDTSSKSFGNYYKDISEKVKTKEIDILIVVNMFLTGFDAKTLNTLWVDKNMRYHGLLQAFSRTNRILNSVKTHGNIICFRNLTDATHDAIGLFGDKDASQYSYY